LALRIGFINQIADLCEQNGADVQDVIKVIGLDKRIGSHYWYPGFGYGGSCFPKDVKEIAYYSKEIGQGDNLFVKLNEINDARIPKLLERFGQKMGGWNNKKVAVLGLSFKPNTDDMREAPSTRVIPWLLEKGAQVAAFDPKAMEVAQKYFPAHKNLEFYNSVADAAQNADVIIVLIEWKEIVTFDYSQVKTNKEQWILDARNQLNAQQITNWGFTYLGIGTHTEHMKGAA
jgi:UDPglucose 6-dehydrogenase